MPKSKPGQPHHPPREETQYGREYAALLAMRDDIRQERRMHNEILQALKDQIRAARHAHGDLIAAIAQQESQRETIGEATRNIMREVIAAELAPFRQSIMDQCKRVSAAIAKADEVMQGHVAEIMGFESSQDLLGRISKEVTRMLLDDLAERNSQPLAVGGVLLEIIRAKKEPPS